MKMQIQKPQCGQRRIFQRFIGGDVPSLRDSNWGCYFFYHNAAPMVLIIRSGFSLVRIADDTMVATKGIGLTEFRRNVIKILRALCVLLRFLHFPKFFEKREKV